MEQTKRKGGRPLGSTTGRAKTIKTIRISREDLELIRGAYEKQKQINKISDPLFEPKGHPVHWEIRRAWWRKNKSLSAYLVACAVRTAVVDISGPFGLKSISTVPD